MGTLIVFAEFYREERLLKYTRASEFTLLFNRGNEDVRLETNWNNEVEPADFALLVKSVVDPSGTKSWRLETHQDSPSDRVEIISGLETRSFPPGPDSVRDVADGEVFSFLFSPGLFHKDIRMMLKYHEGNKMAKATEEVKTVDDIKESSTLEVLPTEVLFQLMKNLSWQDVVYSLPFVSGPFFDVAKNLVSNWAMLCLETTSIPTTLVLRAICQSARKTCRKIRFFDTDWMFHDTSLLDPLVLGRERKLSVFVDSRWPQLTSITWHDTGDGFDASLFRHGIRKGNFPNLTHLDLQVNNLRVGWDMFHNCRLTALEDLSISINRVLEPAMTYNFQVSFPALKRLSIVLFDRDHWNGLFPLPQNDQSALQMPVLEALSVSFNSRMDPATLLPELAVFRNVSVKHLELKTHFVNGMPVNEAAFRTNMVVPAADLFGLFGQLRSLTTKGLVVVDWARVGYVRLMQVERLDFEPRGPVPLARMLNLDHLTIKGTGAPADSAFSLEGLFGHLKLRKLCLGGRDVLSKVAVSAANVENACRNVVAVEVMVLGSDMDKRLIHDLERILWCLPAVRCLKVQFEKLSVTGKDIFTLLRQKVVWLRHLVLCMRVPTKNGDGGEEPLMELRLITHNLPGRWTMEESVFPSPGVADSVTLTYRRKGNPTVCEGDCFLA